MSRTSSLNLYSYQDGVALYVGKHSTPGATGTTLEFRVKVARRGEVWRADVDFIECDAPTPQEALSRLAGWLSRAADAVGSFDGTGAVLPFGGGAKL